MSMNASRFFLIVVSMLLCSACEYFIEPKKSPETLELQVEAAKEWTSNDEFPSFTECDSFLPEDQQHCFENIILDHFYEMLSEQNIVVRKSVQDTVYINLHIDTLGVITLQHVEKTEAVASYLPNLDSLLHERVATLPKAHPAVKTNIGKKVNATLRLPIVISAN